MIKVAKLKAIYGTTWITSYNCSVALDLKSQNNVSVTVFSTLCRTTSRLGPGTEKTVITARTHFDLYDEKFS